MISKEDIIAKLNLVPHPKEGGYFFETYRSKEEIYFKSLPHKYSSQKSFSTAIYYLLTLTTCSRMHRLCSDELFHFYLGDPVTVLHLYPDGSSKTFVLGSNLMQEEHVQLLAPQGVWQGAFLKEGGVYALLGTTVAPSFDYVDYEDGIRSDLIKKYPENEDIIIRLTLENV